MTLFKKMDRIFFSDITCLRKMESISLNKTITFQQNNHQYLILSDEHNNQMFVKLLVKLKPLPDTVMLRLREILEEKDLIEVKFLKIIYLKFQFD